MLWGLALASEEEFQCDASDATCVLAAQARVEAVKKPAAAAVAEPTGRHNGYRVCFAWFAIPDNGTTINFAQKAATVLDVTLSPECCTSFFRAFHGYANFVRQFNSTYLTPPQVNAVNGTLAITTTFAPPQPVSVLLSSDKPCGCTVDANAGVNLLWQWPFTIPGRSDPAIRELTDEQYAGYLKQIDASRF